MKRLLCPVAVLLFSVTARTAIAAVLSQGTLQQYIDLGHAGGQIDDKLFYDFTYSADGSVGATAIPASAITVTPISTPLNPGLRFSANWTVSADQRLESHISFKVQVLPGGAPITDISARMDDFGFFGFAGMEVSEKTDFGDIVLLDFFGQGTKAFDEKTFAPTMGPINVTEDITVFASFLSGSLTTAHLSSVTNQFSETIPEPSTLLIWSVLGSLAVAAGWWRRRR